ncbi:MAG TPA: helical backbone metal receptor [Chitinispirillaceae bacterium]|nr:helical backbone metal receptor [Chitinispirillaceae bacterium]
MAPSVTEIIYALSLQNRLVGVSSFCKYPAEVRELPTVGGYINPDYEQILKLKPDLVILLEEHVNVIEFLKKHKIEYLKVDNDSCSAILNSIKTIAQICGARIRGEELVKEMWKKLNKVPSSPKRPKILICIGRNGVGNGKVEKVYAAGRKSFYNELIVTSGGVNACIDSNAQYPTISVEGIIRLEPDIIIDCSSSMEKISLKSIVKDWESLDMMKAVKTGDVYSLSDDFVTIPGPRIVLIADKFRSIVNGWNHKNG